MQHLVTGLHRLSGVKGAGLLPGVHFPIPAPWRRLLALHDRLQCLPSPVAFSPAFSHPRLTRCLLCFANTLCIVLHYAYFFCISPLWGCIQGRSRLVQAFFVSAARSKMSGPYKAYRNVACPTLKLCAPERVHPFRTILVFILRVPHADTDPRAMMLDLFVIVLKLFGHLFYHL